MTWQEIRQEIYKTVEILVEKRIKQLQYNYCVEGQVKQINKDPRDSTKIKSYNVMINNSLQTVYIMNEGIYQIGDVVYVLVINKNYSNKYILCKKPSVII